MRLIAICVLLLLFGASAQHKSLRDFSVEEVNAFLEQHIGSALYREVVEKHRVDGSLFVRLDDETWKTLGVDDPVHRKAILNAVSFKLNDDLRRSVDSSTADQLSVGEDVGSVLNSTRNLWRIREKAPERFQVDFNLILATTFPRVALWRLSGSPTLLFHFTGAELTGPAFWIGWLLCPTCVNAWLILSYWTTHPILVTLYVLSAVGVPIAGLIALFKKDGWVKQQKDGIVGGLILMFGIWLLYDFIPDFIIRWLFALSIIKGGLYSIKVVVETIKNKFKVDVVKTVTSVVKAE